MIKNKHFFLYFRLHYHPDGSISFSYGDGDGTVNLRSLEVCLKWIHQQTQKVYHKKIFNVDHMETLDNINVLNYIGGVLSSS